MKYLFLTFIICAANAYSSEAELKATDYARGIELVTEQPAAIYKLSLPEEVYRYVTKNNLSDIRVFNQNNEPVPHVIRQSKKVLTVDVKVSDLPYFPISTDATEQLGNDLDITISSSGKVIRIQSEAELSTLQKRTTKHYLIDASHIGTPISSLDFQFAGTDSDYAKAIKLEYSNDLNQWRPLVNRATLTNLQYGDYSLKNTSVDLPNQKIKYMRFSWLDDTNDLTIASIKANLRTRHLSDKEYWSIAEPVIAQTVDAIYEFDTGGVFNIEQLDIQLPEDNTLIDVVIESRINNDTEWRRQFSGIFYKLSLLDTEITNKPANIRSTTDRYWRIKLQSTDGIGQAKPKLKYAWRPVDLFFLARGKGPYMLAYGNATATQTSRPTSSLMDVVNQNFNHEMVGVAKTGKQVIFKGDAATAEKLTLPWERIALWFVLVVGVIVIGVMVFRLFKQMRESV